MHLNRHRHARVVLVVLLLATAACTHLGSLSEAIYDLTEAAVTATEDAYTAALITEPQFRQASLIEHQVAVAGSVFTRLLRANQQRQQSTDPNAAVPLLQAVRKAVRDLQAMKLGPLSTALEKLNELDATISRFMGADLASRIGPGA